MKNKLAIATIARNEEEFITSYVKSALKVADFVFVGDTSSEDMTVKLARKTGAIVFPLSFETLLQFGFAHARNSLLEKIPPEINWVHWLDVDERIDTNKEMLIGGANATLVDVITPSRMDNFSIENWENFMARGAIEHKVKGHPHGKGFLWRGYIHEELYQEYLPANFKARPIDVRHYHYCNNRQIDNSFKCAMYAWMVRRAIENPPLQIGTHPYWFNEWPQTIDVNSLADNFTKVCPEAGDVVCSNSNL